jgi:hypothetical protein
MINLHRLAKVLTAVKALTILKVGERIGQGLVRLSLTTEQGNSQPTSISQIRIPLRNQLKPKNFNVSAQQRL